jgi:branched-chain amino acid aminotransferase
MEEAKFIWMNGKFVPWEKAQVHFLTHGLHYGSAVFEGIRCYEAGENSAVFRLKDHLKRFHYSASALNMKIPFTEEELYRVVIDLVKMNELKECYIRPLAYFGYGQMGLNPVGAKVEVGVAAWPWGAYLGEDGIKHGIVTKISPWVRPPRHIMPTAAKVSGSYVNSIMAKVDAIMTGYTEGLLLDIEGNIAECTGENIFIVEGSVLITPTLDNALEGITRDSIIKIARDQGIKVEERNFPPEVLYAADESFLTGTAAEITPIREVDGRKIGEGKPGPLTRKLQDVYYAAIHGKVEKYLDWLNFVK